MDDRPAEMVSILLETKTFGTPSLVIAARNGHLDVVNYLVAIRFAHAMSLLIVGGFRLEWDRILVRRVPSRSMEKRSVRDFRFHSVHAYSPSRSRRSSAMSESTVLL